MKDIQKYEIWEEGEYTYPYAYGFVPNIHAYLHEDDKVRPVMLVTPGGGYRFVCSAEGESVALTFYEMGYQVFVLTYTTNCTWRGTLGMQPLKDISRAVRYIRKHADAFHVDSENLFVCGFSAGGHLCGSLAVHHGLVQETNPLYEGISNKPKAAILSYPVISSGKYRHEDSFVALLGAERREEESELWSLEKHVSKDTAPCFVWTTAEDTLVPVQNSFLFVEAMKEQGIRCGFHYFSYGDHGLSAANEIWAKGIYEPGYTYEQLDAVSEHDKEGRKLIATYLSWLYRYGVDSKELIGPREVHEEAKVWTKLADSFLKRL